MGMSFCKCTNIFEPTRLKPRKDPRPATGLFQDLHLTKEARCSPDQSSKYFEKASLNNDYQDYKTGGFPFDPPNPNVRPQSLIQGGQHSILKNNKPRAPEPVAEASMRSIEGNNTPHVHVHEIKRNEGRNEVPVNIEGIILRRFEKDAFLELFRGVDKQKEKKLEEIAP